MPHRCICSKGGATGDLCTASLVQGSGTLRRIPAVPFNQNVPNPLGSAPRRASLKVQCSGEACKRAAGNLRIRGDAYACMVCGSVLLCASCYKEENSRASLALPAIRGGGASASSSSSSLSLVILSSCMAGGIRSAKHSFTKYGLVAETKLDVLNMAFRAGVLRHFKATPGVMELFSDPHSDLRVNSLHCPAQFRARFLRVGGRSPPPMLTEIEGASLALTDVDKVPAAFRSEECFFMLIPRLKFKRQAPKESQTDDAKGTGECYKRRAVAVGSLSPLNPSAAAAAGGVAHQEARPRVGRQFAERTLWGKLTTTKIQQGQFDLLQQFRDDAFEEGRELGRREQDAAHSNAKAKYEQELSKVRQELADFKYSMLKDRIPFHCLDVLDHCWDWAHGMANVRRPLRTPSTVTTEWFSKTPIAE